MITKEINLGKVAPVGKREYSTETSYDVLDIVSYHGQSYMSLHADNVGNDPSADSDETHWMLLAERGESWYQMCVRTGRFTGTEEEFLNEKQKQIDDATAAAKTANKSSEEALKQASNAKVQADRARDIAIITEELYALVERENNTWMAKEQARENAELARANAEKLRAQAETTRVSNENTRVSQEETRQTNESTRNLSEETRVKREAIRVEIENIRIDNENARKEAERLRIANEDERVSEETKRVNAENVRAESETERNLSEKAREESEKGRVEAEQARVAAEKLREQKRIECEQATDHANNQASLANDAAVLAQQKASLAQIAANSASAVAEEAAGKVSDMNTGLSRLEELEATLTAKDRKQPTSMVLTYPKKITFGNMTEQRIKATLSPAGTGSNVLFLSDNRSVNVFPDGFIKVLSVGKSFVHAIPTENTAIYQTVEIEVLPTPIRKVTSTAMRLTSSGAIRLG